MMLFIYGPSAIGKTTFLKSVQWDLVPPTGSKLVVVYADHCEEHHQVLDVYCDDTIGDVFASIKKGKKWGGKRAEKEPMRHLYNMIGDDRTMWVVECMRYLNGLWPELIEAHQRNGGGLRIIVPYYTGEVGQYFRQQRCDKLGKEMSEYWTVDNCLSESDYRVNSCRKHLQPVGIPCIFISIDKERRGWDTVRKFVMGCLIEDADWYDG